MGKYSEDINRIHKKLLSLKNFDIASFVFNYRRMIDNLYFFHNIVGKKANNLYELSKVTYSLPKDKRPKEGQVAYFYIENSYPKEIYNSHWCLVLKDFGNTMVIIPTTSIKNEAEIIDESKEFLIEIKDFEESGKSKLKVTQIFSADTIRIDKDRKIYDLSTDFYEIKEKIKNILF